MTQARFIARFKPKRFFLISGITCIVLFVAQFSTRPILREYSKYFLTVENANAKILNCDDDFIVDKSEQKNENGKEFVECKGSKKVFGHSLEEKKQFISNYTFQLSDDLMKRLQLDKNGILKLSSQKMKNETYFPTFVTALSNNHFEESVGLINSLNTFKKEKFSRVKIHYI